jgi:hypothetical protein
MRTSGVDAEDIRFLLKGGPQGRPLPSPIALAARPRWTFMAKRPISLPYASARRMLGGSSCAEQASSVSDALSASVGRRDFRCCGRYSFEGDIPPTA